MDREDRPRLRRHGLSWVEVGRFVAELTAVVVGALLVARLVVLIVT